MPKQTTNTKISDTEAELSGLQRRRASLAARHDATADALDRAKAARTAILVAEDDPAPAKLAAADKAVREAGDSRTAAAEAAVEIEELIASTGARLAALMEAEQREERAGALEASAKAAEAAIERIRKAANDLNAARHDLVCALLPDSAICYTPPSNAVSFGPRFLTTTLSFDHHGDAQFETLDVDQVSARIVGHLVTVALPSLGIARLEDVTKLKADGQSTAVLAPVAADDVTALLTEPMHAAAARMREGVVDAVPQPPKRRSRRVADRWTTDAEGRSFDDAGVRVTNTGRYLDDMSEAA